MTVTTSGVPMAGMYSIMTDAPYIDPKSGIKRKATKKVNRSPFMNKHDANVQHIKGEMDHSGKKKSRIEERIDNKMKEII